MLDIAALNSFVIWKAQNPNSSLKRDRFLTNLASELVTPNVMRRAQATPTNKITRAAMKDFFEGLGIPNPLIPPIPPPPQPDEALRPNGRCFLCVQPKKSSRLRCGTCQRFVCSEHSLKTSACLNCADDHRD